MKRSLRDYLLTLAVAVAVFTVVALFLIRAVPLTDHLYSLKEAVYENPTRNLAEAPIGEGFCLEKTVEVRREMHLSDPADISHLFGMTPYAHKTSLRDMEKLAALTELKTEMHVGILVYRKK